MHARMHWIGDAGQAADRPAGQGVRGLTSVAPCLLISPPIPLPLTSQPPSLLATCNSRAAGTVDFLRNLEMSDDELSKAIIGTIGDVDSYQLPGAARWWGGMSAGVRVGRQPLLPT